MYHDRTYRMTGSLFIESTYEQARYAFDMEWSDYGEPTPLDVLDYMIEVGIIQILHEGTELLDTEGD